MRGGRGGRVENQLVHHRSEIWRYWSEWVRFCVMRPCLGCRRFLNNLSCELGGSIIIPSIINKESGQRIIDIDYLTLTCAHNKDRIIPTPTHSWTKDGVPVIRGITLGQRPVIDAAFFSLEDNVPLFMIQPVPVVVANTLSVVVDFRASNVSAKATSLLPGTSRTDLRTYILDRITGEWTCGIMNVFGNDSKTSIVTGIGCHVHGVVVVMRACLPAYACIHLKSVQNRFRVYQSTLFISLVSKIPFHSYEQLYYVMVLQYSDNLIAE